MFIIGDASKYALDYVISNKEIKAYCKSEGVSLMDITSVFEKKSIIEIIKKMFR